MSGSPRCSTSDPMNINENRSLHRHHHEAPQFGSDAEAKELRLRSEQDPAREGVAGSRHRGAFQSLVSLCRDRPEMAWWAGISFVMLKSASEHISAIRRYKNLHDALHTAWGHCFVLRIESMLKKAPDSSLWDAEGPIVAEVQVLLPALEGFISIAREPG